jgi:regulator of protease activity HflC (stomatin/prohibitin superfamily)
MTWIGLMIAAVIVCGIAYPIFRALQRASEKSDDVDAARRMRALAIGTCVVFALWVVVPTLASSIHTVEKGHVGLVYTFRDITGQTGAGLVTTWPWQTVESASVQQQAIRPITECYDGKFNECAETFSKESLDVFVVPVLNLSVAPKDIQWLYRNVPDYLNRIVRPRMNQILKDETVKYAAVDIAPNREVIRAAVKERLRTALAAYSITVEDLLIDNVDFPAEFKQAIADKQVATQEALRQKELVAAETAKAEQKAAAAEGEASRLRIEAQGQADANALITASLTPALIQWQAVQKLTDNVSIALIPSGQGIIIDPANMLKTTP